MHERLPLSLTRCSSPKLRLIALGQHTRPERRAGAFRVLVLRAQAFGDHEEIADLEALQAALALTTPHHGGSE